MAEKVSKHLPFFQESYSQEIARRFAVRSEIESTEKSSASLSALVKKLQEEGRFPRPIMECDLPPTPREPPFARKKTTQSQDP